MLSTAFKHLLGVVVALLAMWGAGFIYTAGFDINAVWWREGSIGVACWIGATAIYRLRNRLI
jgi:hypothetical protein